MCVCVSVAVWATGVCLGRSVGCGDLGENEGAGNGIWTGLFWRFAPRTPVLAVKFVENGWKDHPPTEGSD